MITIVLAFVFFLYPMFHSTDTTSNQVRVPKAQGYNTGAPAPSDPGTSITTAPNQVRVPKAQGYNTGAPAPSDPGTSITTAELITEGTTVSGSLVPGQDRHFFQFKAASTKIRVILRKRSQSGFSGAVDVYDYNESKITGSLRWGSCSDRGTNLSPLLLRAVLASCIT